MSTKIYGASDDLIEFEGDFSGEAGCYGTDRDDRGVLVVMSDGTMLEVKYGKPEHGGVWAISLIERGPLFERIDICVDEDADPYSDVAHFAAGITGAYAAKDWQRVK